MKEREANSSAATSCCFALFFSEDMLSVAEPEASFIKERGLPEVLGIAMSELSWDQKVEELRRDEEEEASGDGAASEEDGCFGAAVRSLWRSLARIDRCAKARPTAVRTLDWRGSGTNCRRMFSES